MQDVTNPASLPYFYCLYDVGCRIDPLSQISFFPAIGPTDPHPNPAPHLKNMFLVSFQIFAVSPRLPASVFRKLSYFLLLVLGFHILLLKIPI
jgi:hypothetical protein